MRKALTALCVIGMMTVSANAGEVLKANYAPAGTNPLQRLMQPKKMTPIPQRSSWFCYTPAGTCQVPGLGYCYCCFAWGCANGST